MCSESKKTPGWQITNQKQEAVLIAYINYKLASRIRFWRRKLQEPFVCWEKAAPGCRKPAIISLQSSQPNIKDDRGHTDKGGCLSEKREVTFVNFFRCIFIFTLIVLWVFFYHVKLWFHFCMISAQL